MTDSTRGASQAVAKKLNVNPTLVYQVKAQLLKSSSNGNGTHQETASESTKETPVATHIEQTMELIRAVRRALELCGSEEALLAWAKAIRSDFK